MREPVRVWLGLAVLGVTSAALAFSGDGHSVRWRTIDGGGGTSAGGAYTLSGTIGQHDAGQMTGGDFALAGGFWGGAGSPPCAGDVDHSGDVGTNDLLAILAAWGPCSGPCPEDIDQNGDVGTSDLLVVLAAWGMCG